MNEQADELMNEQAAEFPNEQGYILLSNQAFGSTPLLLYYFTT